MSELNRKVPDKYQRRLPAEASRRSPESPFRKAVAGALAGAALVGGGVLAAESLRDEPEALQISQLEEVGTDDTGNILYQLDESDPEAEQYRVIRLDGETGHAPADFTREQWNTVKELNGLEATPSDPTSVVVPNEFFSRENE